MGDPHDGFAEMEARHRRSEELSERLLEATTSQRDEARAEVERLKAENAKLREAGEALADAVPPHEGQASNQGIHLISGMRGAWEAVRAWREAAGGGGEAGEDG